MKLSRGETVGNHLILAVFTALTVLPLVGVALTALTPRDEAIGGFAVPSRVDLSNFAEAWRQGHFATYLRASLVVTLCVVAATVLLAVLAGFGFAWLPFPFATPLFFLLLVGLMLPSEAFIIPLYYDLRSAGLTDTYAALILPQVAQSLAFGTFWMRNHFRQFPTSVLEAARLDGARDLRALWQVLVPASRPALVTLCLLVGMWTWNEFLIPLVMVVSENLRTAPLGMAFFQGRRATDYALLAAGGMIIAAPVVLAYSFLQKHFIAGMIGGTGR